ncbi:MAG: transglycosylase domain-containing protein, partial [Patescibacteria group bacterium]
MEKIKIKKSGRSSLNQKQNQPKKSAKSPFFLKILRNLIFVFLIFCLFLLGLFFYLTYNLPRPEKFTESPFIQSTKIYDRTGKVLLYDIYGEEKRAIVPFDQISENLKRAVLASEDSRFYNHNGLDFWGIARSLLINLRSDSVNQLVGGSTITQQLIRSVYLSNQKTLTRKVREIVLSIELERRYSKDQIFDWYLNKVPFGQNTYGVEAASQTYFNKPAKELTLAQSAVLTAFLPAPSYYSPYGPNKHLLLQRKNHILERMHELKYITEDELKAAKEEEIAFLDALAPIKAPHFVMYVKKYLEEKYGEDYLKEKGLKVYTTLDWELQEYAQKVVDEADKTNAKFNAHNTALVVINPKNGQLLSLIGSKDYFGKSYPEKCDERGPAACLFNPKFDVATLGLRQPGSAFKPFIYATAFKKGYVPDTVLWDTKTEFNPDCRPDGSEEKDLYGQICYHPKNYDGLNRGKVSLRSSLAQSLNVPSVKLLYLSGLIESIKISREMGITTLNEPNRYGLSLVLGGGEVTLLEMTSAYGVFAAEGSKTPIVSILKIEDAGGNIIEKNIKEQRKVLDSQTTRLINDILSDNDSRSPMFGHYNALYFENYQVAAKTGTTQYFNDAWTIGYTPFASVGVWVGNNNNESTNKKTGIGLAAPVWRKVMEKLLTQNTAENFVKPQEPQNTNPVLLGQLPENSPP